MVGNRSRATAMALLLSATALLVPADAALEDLNSWLVLSASDGQRFDDFGASLDVDGDWMIVGAPLADFDGASAGAAYFFENIGGEWVERQRIAADIDSGDNFGWDVAISGGWAAVSAPYDGSGTVHTYRLQGGTWVGAADLTGPSNSIRFGYSIDMDGDHLLVGTPGQEFFEPLAAAGKVYLFKRAGTAWNQIDSVTRGGIGSSGQFGYDVAMDGARLVVGAPSRYFEEEIQQGTAWFFDIVGGKFVDRGSKQAGRGLDQYGSFGGSVAIDGNDAFVSDDVINGQIIGLYDGDLFAYERQGSAWVELDYWNFFGQDVTVQNGQAAVGTYYYGEIMLLEKQKGSWTGVHGVSSASNSQLGADVLLHDGVLYAGAPNDDSENDRDTGSVHVFIQGQAPVAIAGEDRDLIDMDGDGNGTANLDGSESYDLDGKIVSHEWRIDGDVVGTGPKVQLELPIGRHRVDLWVTDDAGFKDLDILRLRVVDGPDAEADFSWNPGKPRVGDSTQFTDLSVHPVAAFMRWDWDFDADGITDSTAQHPNYDFKTSDGRKVGLTIGASNGDVLAVEKTVRPVNQAPVADAGSDLTVEDNDRDKKETVTLDGTASSDPDGTAQGFRWRIGSDSIGTGSTVNVDLAVGYHNIDLEVTDDDGKKATDRVVVLVRPDRFERGNQTKYFPDGPTASFGWAHREFTHPHRVVEFTDLSIDPDSEPIMWTWSFGDGASSTDQNPTHIYGAYGNYSVTLTTTDEQGNEGSVEETISIENRPPEIAFEPLELIGVPVGAPVVFHDQSSDPEDALVSWHWDFGDGITSGRQDVGHVFLKEGYFNVTLTVTDDGGLSASSVAKLIIGEPWNNTADGNWTQENSTAALQNGTVLTEDGLEDVEEYLSTFGEDAAGEDDESPAAGSGFNRLQDRVKNLPGPSWAPLAVLGLVGFLIVVLVFKGRKRND